MVDPEEGHRILQLGDEGWPKERKLAGLDEAARAQKARKPLPIHAFTLELHKRNERLEAADTPPFAKEEFIAARLYTGPVFVKYNAVLRGCIENASNVSYTLWKRLCQQNRYATTLHTINSAVTKLGKIQSAAKVYRGISGGVLPDAFWTPNELNVKGGVEYAFTSTTLDREVAMTYASYKGSSQVVMEIQMGMVDRGAECAAGGPNPRVRSFCVPLIRVRSLFVAQSLVAIAIPK